MSLFFFIIISSFVRAETLLTQTVGTSAFQVVTSREVKASEMIARALEKELKTSSAVELSQDNAGHVLFEIAVYRESQSLGSVKLETSEVRSLVSLVKGRLQNNADWKKLEVSDEELKNWVERKKAALEFMKLKSTSLTSIVTDQEIQDYYEKNRVKFGSTPLSDQKDNIRLFLQKENQKQRVSEWMMALKTKYQIRNDLLDIKNENDSKTLSK